MLQCRQFSEVVRLQTEFSPCFSHFLATIFPDRSVKPQKQRPHFGVPKNNFTQPKKMHPPNPNPTAHGPKHAVLNTTEAHQLRWRQANFFFPDPKKMPHPIPAPMFHRTMSLGGSPMRVTPLQTTFGPVFEPRVYISWHIVLGKRRGK